MPEKTAKKTTKKTAEAEPSEVVTQEVNIKEKITTEVHGKQSEVETVEVPTSKDESPKKYDNLTDIKSDSTEPTESSTDEDPTEGKAIKEDVKEEDTPNDVGADGEVGQSDSGDARQATVYGDDFDAVKVEKRFSMSRLLLFILIIVTSAAIFFTGMILYQSNKDDISLPTIPFINKPTPTPTESPSPTPTPTPEIDYSDLTVEVLNGSGVAGAAGAVAGALEGEGFENIEVGNADEQDYTDTEVQMTENVSSDVFDTIASALSEYTVVEGDELDSDSEFDIIVTVGQQNETEE